MNELKLFDKLSTLNSKVDKSLNQISLINTEIEINVFNANINKRLSLLNNEIEQKSQELLDVNKKLKEYESNFKKLEKSNNDKSTECLLLSNNLEEYKQKLQIAIRDNQQLEELIRKNKAEKDQINFENKIKKDNLDYIINYFN